MKYEVIICFKKSNHKTFYKTVQLAPPQMYNVTMLSCFHLRTSLNTGLVVVTVFLHLVTLFFVSERVPHFGCKD